VPNADVKVSLSPIKSWPPTGETMAKAYSLLFVIVVRVSIVAERQEGSAVDTSSDIANQNIVAAILR
jgi:hypothetical protein